MSYHDLAMHMLAQLAPPEQILPSEWGERELILPRASNARPGRVRYSKAQKGMIDAVAEPGVREVVYSTSSQVGKTMSLNTVLGWSMATTGGPILVVRPDETDAAAYMKEVLAPLFAATPVLRNAIRDGEAADDKLFKSFAGGSLALASAWKGSALSARSIRVLLCDEIGRFPHAVSSGEGEPVTMAKRRTVSYRDAIIVLSSTPTMAATCAITKAYHRGDKRLFHVGCEECGAVAPITQQRLQHTPGDPKSARLKCEDCGHLADEGERLRMLQAGDWIATAADDAEPGVVSFHINELASEFSSLERVAAQVDAAVSIEDRKALCNLVWGLPYEASTEVEIGAHELVERAENIAAPYDKRIEFITCGCDVQSDRIEAMFTGYGPNNERWLLNHVKLFGDTSADDVWADLSRLLGSTFKLNDAREIGPSIAFVDGGFSTSQVVKFVAGQRQMQRRCHITFGRAGWDRVFVKEGQKVRGLLRGLIIGVDNGKLAAMKALGLREPGANFVHLSNHLDNDFFEQLTSERLVVRYTRGFPKQTWEKEPHVRNEALDCFVLCNAAASLMKGRAQPAKSAAKRPSIADLAERLNKATNSHETKENNRWH